LFKRMFENSELFRGNATLSSFYEDSYDGALGKLVRVQALINSLNNTLLSSSEREAIIEEAEDLNASISATIDPVENQQILNGIYLSSIARRINSFTEEQSDAILLIAEQCPFHGGDAVYKARGLYNLIDDAVFFDDYDICDSSPKQESGSPKEGNNFLKVKPNPTPGEVNLEFSVTSDQKCIVRLFDSYGKQLLERKINCSEETNYGLDLAKFPAGLYFVKISGDNSNDLIQSIVLQKP